MTEQVTVTELDELCKQAFTLDKESDDAAAKLKAINKNLDEVHAKILAHFENLDKDSYVVKGCGTFFKHNRFTVTIPRDEDKAKFFEYLRQRGIFDEMATVNSATLNSFYQEEVKTQLENGNVDFKMPGIGEAKLITTLRLRKA